MADSPPLLAAAAPASADDLPLDQPMHDDHASHQDESSHQDDQSGAFPAPPPPPGPPPQLSLNLANLSNFHHMMPGLPLPAAYPPFGVGPGSPTSGSATASATNSAASSTSAFLPLGAGVPPFGVFPPPPGTTSPTALSTLFNPFVHAHHAAAAAMAAAMASSSSVAGAGGSTEPFGSATSHHGQGQDDASPFDTIVGTANASDDGMSAADSGAVAAADAHLDQSQQQQDTSSSLSTTNSQQAPHHHASFPPAAPGAAAMSTTSSTPATHSPSPPPNSHAAAAAHVFPPGFHTHGISPFHAPPLMAPPPFPPGFFGYPPIPPPPAAAASSSSTHPSSSSPGGRGSGATGGAPGSPTSNAAAAAAAAAGYFMYTMGANGGSPPTPAALMNMMGAAQFASIAAAAGMPPMPPPPPPANGVGGSSSGGAGSPESLSPTAGATGGGKKATRRTSASVTSSTSRRPAAKRANAASSPGVTSTTSVDPSSASITIRKPYRCSQCGKAFSRPSSLDTHMAVHTGAKPFGCPHPGCGKEFSVRSNLKRHMKIHEKGGGGEEAGEEREKPKKRVRRSAPARSAGAAGAQAAAAQAQALRPPMPGATSASVVGRAIMRPASAMGHPAVNGHYPGYVHEGEGEGEMEHVHGHEYVEGEGEHEEHEVEEQEQEQEREEHEEEEQEQEQEQEEHHDFDQKHHQEEEEEEDGASDSDAEEDEEEDQDDDQDVPPANQLRKRRRGDRGESSDEDADEGGSTGGSRGTGRRTTRSSAPSPATTRRRGGAATNSDASAGTRRSARRRGGATANERRYDEGEMGLDADEEEEDESQVSSTEMSTVDQGEAPMPLPMPGVPSMMPVMGKPQARKRKRGGHGWRRRKANKAARAAEVTINGLIHHGRHDRYVAGKHDQDHDPAEESAEEDDQDESNVPAIHLGSDRGRHAQFSSSLAPFVAPPPPDMPSPPGGSQAIELPPVRFSRLSLVLDASMRKSSSISAIAGGTFRASHHGSDLVGEGGNEVRPPRRHLRRQQHSRRSSELRARAQSAEPCLPSCPNSPPNHVFFDLPVGEPMQYFSYSDDEQSMSRLSSAANTPFVGYHSRAPPAVSSSAATAMASSSSTVTAFNVSESGVSGSRFHDNPLHSLFINGIMTPLRSGSSRAPSAMASPVVGHGIGARYGGPSSHGGIQAQQPPPPPQTSSLGLSFANVEQQPTLELPSLRSPPVVTFAHLPSPLHPPSTTMSSAFTETSRGGFQVPGSTSFGALSPLFAELRPSRFPSRAPSPILERGAVRATSVSGSADSVPLPPLSSTGRSAASTVSTSAPRGPSSSSRSMVSNRSSRVIEAPAQPGPLPAPMRFNSSFHPHPHAIVPPVNPHTIPAAYNVHHARPGLFGSAPVRLPVAAPRSRPAAASSALLSVPEMAAPAFKSGATKRRTDADQSASSAPKRMRQAQDGLQHAPPAAQATRRSLRLQAAPLVTSAAAAVADRSLSSSPEPQSPASFVRSDSAVTLHQQQALPMRGALFVQHQHPATLAPPAPHIRTVVVPPYTTQRRFVAPLQAPVAPGLGAHACAPPTTLSAVNGHIVGMVNGIMGTGSSASSSPPRMVSNRTPPPGVAPVGQRRQGQTPKVAHPS